MPDIKEYPSVNLCRGEWDARILDNAGLQTIGQVALATEKDLRIAAAHAAAPYVSVMDIIKLLRLHGLDISPPPDETQSFPTENAESDSVDDNGPQSGQT